MALMITDECINCDVTADQHGLSVPFRPDKADVAVRTHLRERKARVVAFPKNFASSGITSRVACLLP